MFKNMLMKKRNIWRIVSMNKNQYRTFSHRSILSIVIALMLFVTSVPVPSYAAMVAPPPSQ